MEAQLHETERQADFDRANPAAYAAFTGAASRLHRFFGPGLTHIFLMFFAMLK